MTVVSLLDVRIRTEELGRAAEVMAATLEATRSFAGNLGVEVIRDVADGTHWIAVERWESLAADDAYRAWRTTPEGAAPLNAIVESRALTRCELTDV